MRWDCGKNNIQSSVLQAHHARVNNSHKSREITRRIFFIKNSERAARVREREGGIWRGGEGGEKEGGGRGREGERREGERENEQEIETAK